LPCSFVGANFASFAASVLLLEATDGPETAVAEITSPFSSITIWTETAPEARTAFGRNGNSGKGVRSPFLQYAARNIFRA
jgi:hypothetical protein